jgi:hypothetical protein
MHALDAPGVLLLQFYNRLGKEKSGAIHLLLDDLKLLQRALAALGQQELQIVAAGLDCAQRLA